MATSSRELVRDLPPSAKLVYTVLEYHGDMTQKQIAERSMLSPRTVRHALERLEDIRIVEEDIYFADARQNLYRLMPDPASTEAGSEGARCAE